MVGRTTRRRIALTALGAVVAALAVVSAMARGPSADPATAASHREAPLISLDPPADITDFFMFRSYEPGNADKVVMIMNVIPAEEPSAGPNYFNFDPSVVYSFHIDNDGDGNAGDVQLDFQFENEIRGPVAALGLPLSYLGGVPPASGAVVPPITALDGPGSEGIGLRQKYTVQMAQRPTPQLRRTQELASGLIAVPSNVGPRTMPNYEALAAKGVYDLGNGIRVFAGQRQDPFYIDLGAVFDTLNLRRIPPLLTALEDANDGANPFGVNMLSAYGVHTIAIELPAAIVSGGSQVIGGYASTSRPRATVRGPGVASPNAPLSAGPFVQVQRLANPLVNEVIIGTKDKDRWNAFTPDEEEQFAGYYLKPRFAAALQLVFGFPTGCTPFGTPDCSPNPPAPTDLTLGNFNRTDLVNILLKYRPTDQNLSELLRLNLGVAPKPLAEQKRLSILAGDSAGWPNGRRPKDDVTDIAVRVAGGPLYIENRAGDGVNTDDALLPDRFPFLATPADGRNYVSGGRQTPHQNPPAGTGATAPTAESPAPAGSAASPSTSTSTAGAVVASSLMKATASGRRLVVRVNAAEASAKVRITLVGRNGKALRTVVRTVPTNRSVVVSGLRIGKLVRSAQVRVA